MTNVMGIDQSFTCTGVVVQTPQELILETIETKKDPEDPLSIFVRAEETANNIKNLCQLYEIDMVILEGLSMGGVSNSSRNLAGLQFCIVNMLIELGLKKNITIIAPTSLKKQSVGNGRASKDEMVDGLPEDVKERIMKVPKTRGRYDLTDAYWLCQYGLKTVN